MGANRLNEIQFLSAEALLDQAVEAMNSDPEFQIHLHEILESFPEEALPGENVLYAVPEQHTNIDTLNSQALVSRDYPGIFAQSMVGMGMLIGIFHVLNRISDLKVAVQGFGTHLNFSIASHTHTNDANKHLHKRMRVHL